jgi:8-oxo-dGTP pyrophosphatase MutT (NUDIX family)
VPRFDDAALVRLQELLASRPAVEIAAPELRRAAVLIPLLRDDAGVWSILFSRRSDQLQAHSGQIAFPGGAVEREESLAEGAVREAWEEVGIPRGQVRLIGRMDDIVTHSGFLVAPFVGVISGPIEYVLQESEVVDVFEVTIEDLLVPSQPQVRYVPFRGRHYPAYFYPYGANEIWGLTGRMLKAFVDLLWAVSD